MNADCSTLFEPYFLVAPRDDLQPKGRETKDRLLQFREAQTAFVVLPSFAFNPLFAHRVLFE
jgi:hypothetical protein